MSQIRTTKSELGIPPAKTVTVFVSKAEPKQFAWLNGNLLSIKRMARLDVISVRTPEGWIELEDSVPFEFGSADVVAEVEGEGKIQLVADGILAQMDFFGAIDQSAERARITNSIIAISKERDALAGRLNNPAFVEKAKPEAVEKARADHAEKSAEVERLQAALARLG